MHRFTNQSPPTRLTHLSRVSTILLLCLAGSLAGCSTLKPWERDTHALSPMQIEDLKCQRFERNMEVYREGAVGANGGKSGGGCGCS